MMLDRHRRRLPHPPLRDRRTWRRTRATARFFAYLNLFIFAMLVLILGDNLPVLFVGWEGVGLCSYLLIGFWFTRTTRTRRPARRRSSPTASATSACSSRCSCSCTTRGALDWNGHRRTAPRTCVTPVEALAACTSGRIGGGQSTGDPARSCSRTRPFTISAATAVRPRALPRLHRQERADPALRLAPRRDGRPDAGLRAHPRGHDGHRGRLPRLPPLVRLRALARRGDGHRRRRRRARRRSSRRRSRSSRTTSRRCSPTPR